MANLKAKDADAIGKYLKARGEGTDEDPFIIEHFDQATALKIEDTIARLNSVIQQLGDLATFKTQLQSLVDNNGVIKNFPATQAISGNVGITNFPASQAVSGTVNVGNFPTSQAISGTVNVGNFPASQAVNVSNFPATQAISGSVSISNFPSSQPVAVSNFPAAQSIIDNSATTTDTNVSLAANGTYTGGIRDGLNRNTIRGWVWTNANGTLYIDQSINATTWRQTESIPITGSATQATDFSFNLASRYYRYRYTNGMVAQTVFELISTAFGIGA